MGDKIIITEPEEKPQSETIVVVPKEKPEIEKEVVVTETTKVKVPQN